MCHEQIVFGLGGESHDLDLGLAGELSLCGEPGAKCICADGVLLLAHQPTSVSVVHEQEMGHGHILIRSF